MTPFPSFLHTHTAAYLTAADAWAKVVFDRCNAASAASSVDAVSDSAGDLSKCYISKLSDVRTAGPECIAAETRTMLAAYPRIATVRAACIDAGNPPPPEPTTARTGDEPPMSAPLSHMIL